MDNLNYWIKLLIVIISIYLLSLISRKLIGFFISRQSKRVNVDPTNFSFLKNSISFISFTIGLIIVFRITPSLSSLTKALFAGAGILAAVIGFASQKAFSNIVGGVFILIFRPFRVKDTIELGNGNRGVVEEITLRHTIIRNYENRRIIIPNSIISDETIINSDLIDETIKKIIEFQISYDSDVDLAKSILQREAERHPLIIDNRSKEDIAKGQPLVMIRVISLGEYAITLRAYVWAKSSDDAFVISCDLNEIILRSFKQEGIEIPYPHYSLLMKNRI